jgi:hypothetical protein
MDDEAVNAYALQRRSLFLLIGDCVTGLAGRLLLLRFLPVALVDCTGRVVDRRIDIRRRLFNRFRLRLWWLDNDTRIGRHVQW